MGRKIANHSSHRSQGLKETHNTLKTLKVKLFGAKTLWINWSGQKPSCPLPDQTSHLPSHANLFPEWDIFFAKLWWHLHWYHGMWASHCLADSRQAQSCLAKNSLYLWSFHMAVLWPLVPCFISLVFSTFIADWTPGGDGDPAKNITQTRLKFTFAHWISKIGDVITEYLNLDTSSLNILFICYYCYLI